MGGAGAAAEATVPQEAGEEFEMSAEPVGSCSRSRGGSAEGGVPDEILQLYSLIPPKVREVVSAAGDDARARGAHMELKARELEGLSLLTADDELYAGLLRSRGEPAEEVLQTMLVRAEQLARRSARAHSASLSPPRAVEHSTSVVQITPRVRTASPPQQQRERLAAPDIAPPSARPSMGNPSLCMVSSTRRSTSRGTVRRSVTPRNPTRAYDSVVNEYNLVKAFTKDKTAYGPEATKYGLRPAGTFSPPPEAVKRCELVGQHDPNSIVGRVLKARNSGGAMRSRSARIPAAREPATQQQYSVPGMTDLLRQRNKQASRTAPFGSSFPAQATGYLPREVQAKVHKQKRQQRTARLTAAASQDAETLLKKAKQRKRNPSPPPMSAASPQAAVHDDWETIPR